MKIFLVINNMDFGGGQLTVAEEANRLFRLEHDVRVITFIRSKAELNFSLMLKIPPDKIKHFEFRNFFDAGRFFEFVRFLRRERPDFILSNLFFSNTVARLSKIFCPGVRVMIREGNLPLEKSFAVKIADSILSPLTFKIIVNARAIKTAFLSMPVPQKKIAVIYNGVEPDGACKAVKREDVLRRFGLPEDSLLFLNVASLGPKKGQRYLLEAFGGLSKEYQGLFLAIVGTGGLRKPLENLAEQYGISGSVRFLKNVAYDDLKKLLCAGDIFVLSSLWEGVPNAMLEAMAAGLPIVATSVGGVEEVITDGKNGLLAKAGSAMELALALEKLILSKELKARLGESAKKRAEDFSWDKHVSDLLELMFTR